MTELQCLLTFLCNLRYTGVSKDVNRLTKQLSYVVRHSDWNQAANFVRGLLEFDDQLVEGLNTRTFPGTVPNLSQYPSSVLPKFLFGLTSRIFNPSTGELLSNYDVRCVEMALSALRLVRRCSLPGFQKQADDLAISGFIALQESLKPPVHKVCGDKESTDVAHAMSDVWGFLLEPFEDELQLGFPGPGVTTDMQFPYLPSSTLVDTRTLSGLTRELMVTAVSNYIPDAIDYNWPTCDVVRAYPYDYQRVGKIVAVEKSFKIARPITISPTSSVSIAATLRKTVWNCFKRHRVMRFCNVSNQKRSHRLLRRRFHRLCLRDVRDGSTCFSVLRQLIYLSKSPPASRMFDDSRLLYITYEDPTTGITRLVPITTLTMGDASCTAFLTGNMFVVAFLAIAAIEFAHPIGHPVDRDLFQRVLSFLDENGDDIIAFVGDDVVIDERYAATFDYLLQSQHVTINHRKSSDADSIHKETCGYWIVQSPEKSLREIFPFRAPRLSNDVVGNLSSLRSAYERSMHSEFSLELLIAYCTAFTHSLEFLNNESHTSSFLGSPVGPGQSIRECRIRPGRSTTVPDDIAYVFGFRDCKVNPRQSRRISMERGRIVKYIDPAKPRNQQTPPQSSAHLTPPNPHRLRSRSFSGSPRRSMTANGWLTSLMYSPALLLGLELTS